MSISSLSTDPLFSTVVTLCILILLYFPSPFLGIVLSPILISTSVLLLSLLRLGAIQKENERGDSIPSEINDGGVVGDDCRSGFSPEGDDSSVSGSGSCENDDQGEFHYSSVSFVEWDVRAPLEVIYEEDENDVVSEEDRDAYVTTVERYASLSKFYPETDSDTSEEEDFQPTGGWESSGNSGFRWEGDDGDGMFEIELDGKKKAAAAASASNSDTEEDNLIEIDLHPASLPAEK